MLNCDKKNKGCLIRPVQRKDYIAGKSPIVHEIRIFDSNWSDHATDFELQKQNGFEPMNCVTQAVINSVQSQMNWMIATGNMPQKIFEFLQDNRCLVGLKVHFSKKLISILSETTKQGNYLTKVAQTVREMGLVPELVLPIGGKNWDEFYDLDQVTDEMIAFGKKLFDKDDPNAFFTLEYEWVVTPDDNNTLEDQRAKMMHELKHAPLVIAKSGHSTLKTLGMKNLSWQILDSYSPFLKDRSWAYNAPWVMKVVVNLNEENNKKPMKIVKADSSPHIYLITGDNKKKIMIVDVPSLAALGQPFTVIPKAELDKYEDGGTMLWVSRIIN